LEAGQQETTQAAYIDLNLKAVPGAAKARVKTTLPNRETREKECNSSPCVISVDPRQGAYHLDVTYFGSDGNALSTTSVQRTIVF
jgi:hypothetical protein